MSVQERAAPPPHPPAAQAGADPGPDLALWPGLRRPARAPVRAAAARLLVARMASRTSVRVEIAGPEGAGCPAAGRGFGPVLRVHRPVDFFTRLGRDGKIGFGESYMTGDWDSPGDLAELLEPMARHLGDLVPRPLQRLRSVFDPRRPADEDNNPNGARRNISRHYDLSNDLFALFLDRSMTYSSALFADSRQALEEAQARKIEVLLDSARIGPGTKVLEVGTGWGELALQAARRGATVTTITLSKEQAKLAWRRIEAEGYADRVDVRIADYRQTTGRYDAVVSVEMIEAVGQRWWPAYFRTLEDRLVGGGRLAIQSILMNHAAMMAARDSWTWIHKYIFPGGLVPSLDAISAVVTRHTGLVPLEQLHFGPSYAETLRRWRDRFTARPAEVDALGFDLYFRRMWEFYLAYSEAGFRSGRLDVAQLLYRKPLP
ncbi:MAG: class I SAM-dependent methyltransferase [Acidimicrobiales bacterium]